MARLDVFPLSAWIRYYSNFGARSLERMQEAIERIENEKYTPEKFLSDSVMMWADATVGWWTAMRQTMGGPVPSVFIKMQAGDQVAAEGNVAVDATDKEKPEVTAPIRIGDAAEGLRGGGRPMKAEHLEVGWHPDKPSNLRVIVHRILLPDLKPGASDADREQYAKDRAATPPFQAGLYQSLVHLNGQLLATITILVTEEPAKKP